MTTRRSCHLASARGSLAITLSHADVLRFFVISLLGLVRSAADPLVLELIDAIGPCHPMPSVRAIPCHRFASCVCACLCTCLYACMYTFLYACQNQRCGGRGTRTSAHAWARSAGARTILYFQFPIGTLCRQVSSHYGRRPDVCLGMFRDIFNGHVRRCVYRHVCAGSILPARRSHSSCCCGICMVRYVPRAHMHRRTHASSQMKELSWGPPSDGQDEETTGQDGADMSMRMSAHMSMPMPMPMSAAMSMHMSAHMPHAHLCTTCLCAHPCACPCSLSMHMPVHVSMPNACTCISLVSLRKSMPHRSVRAHGRCSRHPPALGRRGATTHAHVHARARLYALLVAVVHARTHARTHLLPGAAICVWRECAVGHRVYPRPRGLAHPAVAARQPRLDGSRGAAP